MRWPSATFWGLAPAFGVMAVMAVIPLGIIEYIRMMVMNMADRESDAKTWKKTLVVRIGIENAVKIHGVGQASSWLTRWWVGTGLER